MATTDRPVTPFTELAPVDVGWGSPSCRPGWGCHRTLTPHEDLPQAAMHTELTRRRVYLHLCRWTSLGLSLLEAMAAGMPVVALATTEAVAAVPAEAGVVSTRVDVLQDAVRWLLADPDAAHRLGGCSWSPAW